MKQTSMPILKNLAHPNPLWTAVMVALTAGFSAQAQFSAALPPYALSDLGTSVTLGPPQVSSGTGLTYQWSLGGTAIPGATNPSYTTPNSLTAGLYSYTVAISSNAVVLTNLPTTLVNGASLLDSPGAWTVNRNNASWVTLPFVGGNTFHMTDNQSSEASSAFFSSPGPVPIGGFTAAWTYQDVTVGGADGWSFCIQNDVRGLTALGGGGGNIGMVGITPSACFDFDIYGGNAPGGGNNGGFVLRSNGAAPAPYSSALPVAIANGHPINVFVTYDPNTFNIQVTLVDATTAAAFVTNYDLGDLTGVVGSPNAYIGFTAGTGGSHATQIISNFVFLTASQTVSIAVPPANTNATVGQPVTFAVTAAGSPPFTYQWQLMGTNLPGATQSSYSIAQVQTSAAGNYTIIVGSPNATNTASATATLAVSTSVTATVAPASKSLYTGLSQTFTALAYGAPPLSYQWYTNSTLVPGATAATYTTPNTLPAGSYVISVLVQNGTSMAQPSANLTLIAPSPFAQAAVQLNPVGYWPLDEPSGALVAYDYVGGNNGAYVNEPGVSPGNPPPTPPLLTTAGSPYSAFFNGPLDNGYVDIPLDNLNIKGSLTMFAWVQPSSPVPNFETFFGHSDNSYRMDVDPGGLPHFANNPAGDATGTNRVDDGNWHMVAGVYNATNGNRTLYVDGMFAANVTSAGTPAGSPLDVIIGGDPQYIPSRLFTGGISSAALYDTALSASQIQQLYVGAGVAPTTSLPASSINGDLNGSLSITANVVGTPPLSLQWYYLDTSLVVHSVPGQTSATLTLDNLSLSQSGYQYFLVAANNYGSSSNLSVMAPITLYVYSGPPTFLSDISPLTVITTSGSPVQFSVEVVGTAPIFYQWYENNVAIPGATNSTYSFLASGSSNTFYVTASNGAGGPFPSSTATVFGNIILHDGTGWTINSSGTFPTMTPQILNDTFYMTDGNNSEGVSGWFSTKVPINSFTASFTFVVPSGTTPPADGMSFALQNSAVNARGGVFAISGVSPSVEWDINIYPGNNGGVGVSFENNGIIGTPTPPAPIVATTAGPWPIGDPVNVTITYDPLTTIARETLTDTVTGGTFTTNWPTGDITKTLGGTNAWVGFTAATGGLNATMIVSNFTFSVIAPKPTLTILPTGANTYLLRWIAPQSPAFVLQQTPSVLGPWSGANVTPTVSNGVTSVTVTNTATAQFYRLISQ